MAECDVRKYPFSNQRGDGKAFGIHPASAHIIASIRDSLTRSSLCNIMASSCNIKHSIYIGPHTWEPCVLNSLTHRLGPCQHFIVTERIEMCGRNCSISKQPAGDRIRDLDRVYLCPLCPRFSRHPKVSSGDVKAGSIEDEAEHSPNSDSKLLKKTVISNSINNLHLGSHHDDRDMRRHEIQCKSVL